MTNEIKNAALSAIEATLATAFPQAVPVRVSKRNMLDIATGVTDPETGAEIYVTIDVTAKDTKPTKTHEAYNHDNAVAEYEAFMQSQSEKASKPKKSKVNPEAQERREARMKVLRKWILEAMEVGRNYTSTEVADAMPETFDGAMRLCLAGTALKQAADEGLVELEVVEGKKHYHRA